MAGWAAWYGLAASLVMVGHWATVVAADQPVLVIHVDDRVQVPRPEWAAAKLEVERIFRESGIEIGWAEGRFAEFLKRAADRAGHPRAVALMLIDSESETPRGRPGCATLGFAAPKLTVAYAFHNRIVETSRMRPVDMPIVLGRVIAHEVGHLLLPPNSHSRYGIMRADLDLGFTNPNRFTDDQAQALQSTLATQSAQE